MADPIDDRRCESMPSFGGLVDDLIGPSIVSPSFAGYEVIAELGAGGMGQVWRARDLALGREVAVKTIKPDLTPVPTMKERFLREVRALARVKSDHVVSVHHVGESANAPFVVMELLQGESLQACLRRKEKLPISDVLSIGLQACAGLDAIHREGLVHRDVKPSNLWLEDRGGGAFRLKVLDLGLVRATDGDAETLTNSGAFLGTPAYMSPEQAAGLPAEPSSDLFSLGCVLYQALCGQRPFGAQSAHLPETSLGSWEFPAIEKLRPETPPKLAALVGRLLSRDPRKRPKSAKKVGELVAEIQQERGAEPKRMPRWWIPMAAAAIVIAASAYFWPKREVVRVDPQPAKSGTSIAPTPVQRPVPEWVKDRTIRRVAADGTGEFTTIQDALDAIDDGEAIELVGAGPFRETPVNRAQRRNIGLFSTSGAVVELPAWTKNPNDPQTCDCTFLGSKDGFHLSGVEFQFPAPNTNGHTVYHAVNVWGSGSIVVEDCVFWQPSQKTDPNDASPFVLGVVVHVPRPEPIEVRFTGNLFRCGLAVIDYDHEKAPSDVRLTIERNLIFGAKDALWIPFTRGKRAVRENVVSAFENGIGLTHRDEASKDFDLLVENNTFVCNQLLFLGEEKSSSVGKARIFGNAVVNRSTSGINYSSEDKSALLKDWTRSRNWFAQPLVADDTLPLTADERIEANLLESDSWRNSKFAVPRSAASGAKVGAPLGDWFERLRRHPAAKGY
jgi:hypothetical protein